jgi:ATP phosphoribosyltransferase
MEANLATAVTRLALPKGQLLAHTSLLLSSIGLGFPDYNSRTRIYRMQSDTMPGLTAKMLNERDIPVQVAIGNYDFGICSSDWLQELQTLYPNSRVYKVADLDYDTCSIYLACSNKSGLSTVSLAKADTTWRIVTEYPALAEAAACRMRLKKFRIFPLWGSADAYPPENADFAVLKATDEGALQSLNLQSMRKICDSNACIIANRDSLESGDFSGMLSKFSSLISGKPLPTQGEDRKRAVRQIDTVYRASDKKVWLALADGHQQSHTVAFLKKTGIRLEGYSKDDLQRRPRSNMDWMNIKVIRPQDMPQQVANGNFDLAVTGKDWLLDHLYQFPSSPVTKLVDLGFGWVRIVAVVAEDVPADSIEGIRELIARGKMTPLRIATEYINIADKYLRDRHIRRYRVVPTWGATEVYLPEDADMLIENTETGQTLVRHKLKIIDTLFESTACLIGNRQSLAVPYKREKIEKLVSIFREAVTKK